MGNHFSPIILALTPLGWVGDARGLLVIQALTLTGASIPIYLIARDRFGPQIALLWGAAYLIYPPTLYVNLTDWHEIALAPPLLAFAIWFMLNNRYRWMLAMLLVALLVREEIGLIVSAFGLYLVLVHRAWLWGAPIAIGGFAFTAVTALVIIPAFGNAAAGDYLYLDRYGYWGDSVPEIAQSLVSNPLLVLENLLVPDKMTFAALLFVPLGLMSLLGADLLLLALPTLGYILLSNDFAQYDISSQYHAPLAPALFAAAIIGGSRLAARGSRLAARGSRLASRVSRLASRAETLTAGAGVCDGRARRLPGRLSDVRRRARIANRLAGHLRDHRPRPTPFPRSSARFRAEPRLPPRIIWSPTFRGGSSSTSTLGSIHTIACPTRFRPTTFW